MQSENPLIADLVKLANSAAGTFAGMTREARDAGREHLRQALGGLDFVGREEFEAVKAMAAKAREEADSLRRRFDALDAAMAGGQAALEQRLARIAAIEAKLGIAAPQPGQSKPQPKPRKPRGQS